jgi:hypothetical protein
MLENKGSVLIWNRDAFPVGIFTLKLGGYRHNVIFSPMLIKDVLSDAKTKSTEDRTLAVMRNVFGLDSRDEDLYRKLEPELKAAVLPHIQVKKNQRGSSVEIVRHLQANLPDMITFNPSLVDQEPWERLSLITVSEDNNLAEASLL